MPAPESMPSERKIAALLLIAVVAAAIGLYAYSRENPQAGVMLDSIKNKLSITGFSIFSDGSGAPIQIESRLSFEVPPEITLELKKPANEVLLSLEGDTVFTINKMPWQVPRETDVVLKNYVGKLTLGQDASLSGKAASVKIGTASLSEEITVQMSEAKPKYIALTGADSVNIGLKNITGTIDANDGKNSAIYVVDDNTLSISGFSGNIEFYGDRIILRGTGTMNTDILKQGA